MTDDNFEVEIYTLTDEDGVENDFELIGSLELDGNKYVALMPVEKEDDPESDEFEFVILKVTVEDGEESFVTIEDEEEFDKVADAFEDELAQDLDYDEEGEEEEEEEEE